MRLKNAKTIAVGLSNHICELQSPPPLFSSSRLHFTSLLPSSSLLSSPRLLISLLSSPSHLLSARRRSLHDPQDVGRTQALRRVPQQAMRVTSLYQ
eukprot:767174-Hanusia_phi.AAC.3